MPRSKTEYSVENGKVLVITNQYGTHYRHIVNGERRVISEGKAFQLVRKKH